MVSTDYKGASTKWQRGSTMGVTLSAFVSLPDAATNKWSSYK